MLRTSDFESKTMRRIKLGKLTWGRTQIFPSHHRMSVKSTRGLLLGAITHHSRKEYIYISFWIRYIYLLLEVLVLFGVGYG